MDGCITAARLDLIDLCSKVSDWFVGTLVGVGNRRLELAESSFDWVIVDEAGRAQAAELMVALQSGKRVLLVGS